MKLENVLEIKAKEYYDKSESIIKSKKTSQEKLDELEPKLKIYEESLLALSNNENSQINIDAICNAFIEYGYSDIKNDLNNIIVTLSAIKKGLPVMLTEEQKNKYKTYIYNLKSIIKQLKEKEKEYKESVSSVSEEYESLADKYFAIECLIEKIKDPNNLDILDENDFQIVYDIVVSSKDLSYSTKSQMLIQFKEYNEDRAALKEKEIEIVSYDEVVKFFKDNGLSDSFIVNSKKFRDEIERNINLTSALEIIEYMKNTIFNSKHLIDFFDKSTLLTLLVYGSKDTIMERFEEFSTSGELCQLYFKTASVWTNTLDKKDMRKTKKNSKYTPSSKAAGTLKYDSEEISVDDIRENERFLNSKGFKVSRDDKDGKFSKLLKFHPTRLKMNYEIYKKYGFFEVAKAYPTSMLCIYRLLEKCDMGVELGIINGIGSSDKDCNVLKYSPTKLITAPKGFFQYLAKLKLNSRPHEYYGLIVAKSVDGFAKTTIKNQMALNGLGVNCDDETVKKFVDDNFVDVSSEIPNYSNFDEVVFDSDRIDYDDEILSLPLIAKLESKNKKSEFVYTFNNQIISRLKVLRISSTLYEQYHELNNEMLFYAITKGSYIDENVLRHIKEDISYSYKGGLTHGLS